jgi:hypothetical protein
MPDFWPETENFKTETGSFLTPKAPFPVKTDPIPAFYTGSGAGSPTP